MKKIDAPFRATFIFLFLLSVVFGTPAYAAINPQIDFYGTLQNDSGVNLTGTYDIVFRMYDAPTGGTLLATDTHTVANGNPVNVRNGKFAVVLGSGTGNSLAGIDFNTNAHYVGLTINADSEMVPRERMTAAPYAFNSEKLEGYRANQLLRYNATGSITDSASDTILTLRQNGVGNILSLFGGATELFTVLSNGNVGIGTTSPGRDLSVAGDVHFTGGIYDSTNTAGTLGMVLQTTGTSTRWVATSTLGIGGGSSLFTDGGATTYLTALGDNVGIGTTTANAKLTVAGAGYFGGNLTATGTLDISGNATFSTTTMASSTIVTLNLTNALTLNSGGTGANTAAGARTNLGATTVGSNIFTLPNPGALTFLRINADNTVSAVATSTLGIALSDTTGILATTRGGTGLSSYATGDLIYASGANTLANRTIGTTGDVLSVVGGFPTWVATSTLGISGGGGSLFTDGGANTYLTSLTDNLLIGSTTATAKLFVQGNVGFNDVFAIASSSGASLLRLQANGDIAIGLNASVGNSAFTNYLTAIGDSAGVGAFAYRTNFLGYKAGLGAENIIDSNVIGVDAGLSATSSDSSNFMGYRAGYGAGFSSDVNYIGRFAGFNATATNDINGIGRNAGGGASGASYSNFIGWNAGAGALNASSVNFIGASAGSNAMNIDESFFLGSFTGSGAVGADNAIFIGNYAGNGDVLNNGLSSTSILIGEYSSTGGFSDSIAIGARVVNSAVKQLNIGNVLFGTGIYASSLNSSLPVAGGRIGIGTSTPGATLTVAGTFLTTGVSDLSTTTISSGRLGIGTSTPSAQLTTTGTVRFAAFGAGTLQTDASGNVSVSSDERLKDIQGNFTKGLEALALINPIQYTWKPTTGYDTANVYTGFSAQNIQDALPEAVGKNTDGYLSLSDRPLLATVINAIKEIYAWMKTTDTRVELLETKINTLQAEIDGLKDGSTPPQQNSTNTNSSADKSNDSKADTPTTSPPVEEVKEELPVIENPPETTPKTNTSIEIPAEVQIVEQTTESL